MGAKRCFKMFDGANGVNRNVRKVLGRKHNISDHKLQELIVNPRVQLFGMQYVDGRAFHQLRFWEYDETAPGSGLRKPIWLRVIDEAGNDLYRRNLVGPRLQRPSDGPYQEISIGGSSRSGFIDGDTYEQQQEEQMYPQAWKILFEDIQRKIFKQKDAGDDNVESDVESDGESDVASVVLESSDVEVDSLRIPDNCRPGPPYWFRSKDEGLPVLIELEVVSERAVVLSPNAVWFDIIQEKKYPKKLTFEEKKRIDDEKEKKYPKKLTFEDMWTWNVQGEKDEEMPKRPLVVEELLNKASKFEGLTLKAVLKKKHFPIPDEKTLERLTELWELTNATEGADPNDQERRRRAEVRYGKREEWDTTVVERRRREA
ncbi:unnamed protein product [Amoebophrya sp. A120]|nr:unnamed protein product [Amoebophrya sp. A120]|eukprot:GSA120T00006825001.1